MNGTTEPHWGVVIFLIAAILLTSAATFGFWLWMLIDCLKNEAPGSSEKITWGVLIVVFGLLGAFAYNVGRRNKRMRELGR